jgi:hypothetical protein
MTRNILDILEEILASYEDDDEISTKLLEDLKEEIETSLYERATTIDTLADMWDDSDGETEY